jgi:predicted acyl esterase
MTISDAGSRRVHRAVRLLTIAVLALGAGASASAADAAYLARGSAEQVDVTGVAGGAKLTLLNAHGKKVATIKADAQGGALFRNVTPGHGYKVAGRSGSLSVFSDASAPPSTKSYRQTIPTSGFGYLTTRDGTQLSIDVHLPAASSGFKAPYPTLVEYAGYGYSDPAGPDSGIAPIANLLGFAVVDVNMRGTGCSGGAFDFFEPLQGLDGYDVVETVAHQSWVLHHKVGLMGVSYGGISQLFVAETRPPDLAAITPLSVIDSAESPLYAGGILNTGFTVAWIKDRVHDAQPASTTGGEPWVLKKIQTGDKTCKANQALHGEQANLLAKVAANKYFVAKVAAPLSPNAFVHKIDVPVFLACQWTDEQTGGHCADIAEHFTGTAHKWFTFTNGVHTDSLDPATFERWYDFMELYVARQKPQLSPAIQALAPTLYNTVLGVPGVMLPVDPIDAQPTYAAALAAFQALPSVRVLFDNGAGGTAPGQPLPGFEQSFPSFPIPGTQAQVWYLAPGGGLTDAAPATASTDQFTWNPKALPSNDFSGPGDGTPGTGLWNATPAYNWMQNPAGTAVSYLTAPLPATTTVVGAGTVDLWLKANAPSVDLQVTVSEVRPDGLETFVQNGWLRASARKLTPASTPLDSELSLTKADAAPLPAGQFTKVTVPLYYEGHAYRAGSQIRITVAAPGGTQPVWGFSQTLPAGTAQVSIGYGASMPSRLVLPVVPSITVPTPLPPCPGLRGEPCRSYVPIVNQAG